MQTVYFVNAFVMQGAGKSPLSSGNPAAVCILDAPLEDATMQLIAAQHNLSETAFVTPLADVNRYHIRWFTPSVEVKLCGHATLASAHVLFETGVETGNVCVFESLSGPLTVTRGDGLEMQLPLCPAAKRLDTTIYTQALGIPLVAATSDGRQVVLECETEGAVLACKPDFNAVQQLPESLIYLTARAGHCDFVCRVFAPKFGINEDPVTGSAYCCLVPYWANKLGKTRLTAEQVSQRGGALTTQLLDGTVSLKGEARTIIEGRWLQAF